MTSPISAIIITLITTVVFPNPAVTISHGYHNPSILSPSGFPSGTCQFLHTMIFIWETWYSHLGTGTTLFDESERLPSMFQSVDKATPHPPWPLRSRDLRGSEWQFSPIFTLLWVPHGTIHDSWQWPIFLSVFWVLLDLCWEPFF